MKRIFFGAKAKAAIEKRNRLEMGRKESASDNERSVAYHGPALRPGARDWRVPAILKEYKGLCEHCGFDPPVISLLHAHHIIPVSCGGADRPENMIVLCPTCHAIAHYVTQRSNRNRQYAGPSTAGELRRWMSAAYNPIELNELQRGYTLKSVAPMLAEMRA
jgi:5-methylcytosine-specific restriction endonuclease McrA